ncbi:MAG: carboxypeptidase-like regulatory domain-containing protein [bacterium]|nr:carboxypeptidase-like regulatory domain-containing protein [bacterium]
MGVVGAIYLFGAKKDNLSEIQSFEDCFKAGYPVMESYPRQCRTTDNKYFVEKTQSDSGIYGKATLGPTCPVQKIGQECNIPYQGTVIIKNYNQSQEVTSFTTDSKGEFRVSLPPGTYYLSVGGNRFPFLKTPSVEVKTNQYTKIDLNADTGIR